MTHPRGASNRDDFLFKMLSAVYGNFLFQMFFPSYERLSLTDEGILLGF